MSEAAVDLLKRLQSSSSPSPSDKKKFAELSPDNKETVILHVNLDIAEQLVIEIPNDQIDQVCARGSQRQAPGKNRECTCSRLSYKRPV